MEVCGCVLDAKPKIYCRKHMMKCCHPKCRKRNCENVVFCEEHFPLYEWNYDKPAIEQKLKNK